MRRFLLTCLFGVLALAAPAAANPPRGGLEARAARTHRPGKATKVAKARGRHAKARLSPRERAARLAVYRASVTRWQTLGAGVHTTWQAGMRDIVVSSVNTGETAVVRPFRPDGSLDPEAATTLRHLLRDQRASADHEVDPRLVSVLYRLVSVLDAPQVNLISGFRVQRGRGHSLHGEGRAIDIILPGVDPERVAEVARGFGHTGVGVYPTSGFVHVDVRDRSYFWVDRSGPGQRGRVVQVRSDESRAADAAYDPASDRIQPRADAPEGAAAVTVDVTPVPSHRGRPGARHRRSARRPGKLRAGHR